MGVLPGSQNRSLKVRDVGERQLGVVGNGVPHVRSRASRRVVLEVDCREVETGPPPKPALAECQLLESLKHDYIDSGVTRVAASVIRKP